MFSHNEDKPPSRPRNWPYSSEDDIAERPKRLINIGTPQDFLFVNNFVKTSKYELWNFLPKFLLEEFNPKTKIANCYFLMISALQCVPRITNTGGLPTTMLPLLVVVLVGGIFHVIEDLARHKADKEANSSITTRYDMVSRDFVKCHWFELEVGNISVYAKSGFRVGFPGVPGNLDQENKKNPLKTAKHQD